MTRLMARKTAVKDLITLLLETRNKKQETQNKKQETRKLWVIT